MEHATQSKNARRIESALLNKLASISQKTFAEKLGIAEYQVSRMKKNFFRQMSMAIDILEYEVADDDAARLAKAVAKEVVLILYKEKAGLSSHTFPACCMDYGRKQTPYQIPHRNPQGSRKRRGGLRRRSAVGT